MTPEEQLKEWLGEGWLVDTRDVSQDNWNNRAWRAQFLCEQAQLKLFHLHDGQEEEGSAERKIYFGLNIG